MNQFEKYVLLSFLCIGSCLYSAQTTTLSNAVLVTQQLISFQTKQQAKTMGVGTTIVNGSAVNTSSVLSGAKSLTVTPKAVVVPPVKGQTSSTVTSTVIASNPMFSLSFNPKNLAQTDILWTGGLGFSKGGNFTTSTINLSNLYQPQGTTDFGLVRMNVSVSDGSAAFLAFNFNEYLFNTIQMQQLIQNGMYVSVVKSMSNNVPMVTVQLSDASGTVYAQGSTAACINTNAPTTNFNPTQYYIGINTYNGSNADGIRKILTGPINIGQTYVYKQTGITPVNAYLTLPWTNNEGFVQGYTGNPNIANITPVTVQSTQGVPFNFNIGMQNFASSTAVINGANLHNRTALTCTVPLNLVSVGIFDGQGAYITFNFTQSAVPLLATLATLGLFVIVDLIQSGQTGGPSVNVYLADVNGTVYAQATQILPENATPWGYNVGFNTDYNSTATGTTNLVISDVVFNKIVWYQQAAS